MVFTRPCILLAFVISHPAHGQLQRISPHVDHVRTSLMTEKTHVTFGYTNYNHLTLDIPFGIDNFVLPAPRYRYQPLRFTSLGRYDEVFTVEINPGEWIEWRILSSFDPEIPSIHEPVGPNSNFRSVAYADTTMGSFFVDAN